MDSVMFLVKEASDAEELIDTAASLYEDGYLSGYEFSKLASVYDSGDLDLYYSQQDVADLMLDKIASDMGIEKEAGVGRVLGKAIKGTAKGISSGIKGTAKGISSGIKGTAKGIAKGTKSLADFIRRRRRTRFERMRDEWNSWSPKTRKNIKRGLAGTGIGSAGIVLGYSMGKNSGRSQGHKDRLK